MVRRRVRHRVQRKLLILCLLVACALVVLRFSHVGHEDAHHPAFADDVFTNADSARAWNALIPNHGVESGSVVHTSLHGSDISSIEALRRSPACRLGDEVNVLWRKDDIRPVAKDYLQRHVLLAVITGDFDRYYRLDAAECTWLAHFPSEQLVVVTNRLSSRDGRRGEWVEGTEPANLNYSLFDWKRKMFGYPVGWIPAQFRFYDGFRRVLSRAAEETNVKWVIVLDDDTFLNLNNIVAMLHEYDLRNLYELAVPEWQDISEAGKAAWEAACVNNYTAEETAAAYRTEAVAQCGQLPAEMRRLEARLRRLFPHVGNLTQLLAVFSHETVYRAESPAPPHKADDPATPGDELTALYHASLRLLAPLWVRERLLRRRYTSYLPWGGVGHFLNRAAHHTFRERFDTDCIARYMLTGGWASDDALRFCLPGLGISTVNDSRLLDPLAFEGAVWRERIRQPIVASVHLNSFMLKGHRRTVEALSLCYNGFFHNSGTDRETLMELYYSQRLLHYLRREMKAGP